MADNSQKTEQATPKRLEKARREGQFPSAREMVSACEFVAFAALLAAGGPAWFDRMRETARWLLGRAFAPGLSAGDLAQLAVGAAARIGWPLAEAGGLLVAVALGSQLAATRMGVSLKKV